MLVVVVAVFVAGELGDVVVSEKPVLLERESGW